MEQGGPVYVLAVQFTNVVGQMICMCKRTTLMLVTVCLAAQATDSFHLKLVTHPSGILPSFLRSFSQTAKTMISGLSVC